MLNELLFKVTNAVPRTERQLSLALALFHVISGTRDYMTVDNAKEILKDYIDLDEQQYNSYIRKRHLQLMKKIDWPKVIQDSLKDEFILMAQRDLDRTRSQYRDKS